MSVYGYLIICYSSYTTMFSSQSITDTNLHTLQHDLVRIFTPRKISFNLGRYEVCITDLQPILHSAPPPSPLSFSLSLLSLFLSLLHAVSSHTPCPPPTLYVRTYACLYLHEYTASSDEFFHKVMCLRR